MIMHRRFQPVLTYSIAICATGSGDAFAAETSVSAGLDNIAPALIIFTLAISLLLALLFRPSFGYLSQVLKHKIGVWRIHKALAQKSKNVIDDILIPGAFGGLTHIDHVVLTSGGILCIQTNHYDGILFGETGDPQWTNVDGNKRRKFLNPLIRNEARTRALQKIIPEVPVASLIVFTGDIQFTSPTEKNVIHVNDLGRYIAKFVFGPCRIDDWDALWMTVKSATLGHEATRKNRSAQFNFS